MQTFITKQPILDQHKKIYAYELLSRSHIDAASEFAEPNQDLSQVVTDIDTFLAMKHIRQGRRMFVSTSPGLLLSSQIGRLPKNDVVIRLTDVTDATPEILAACKELKDLGYQLAINILSHPDRLHHLIELADFVNVDFLSNAVPTQSQLPRQYASPGRRFVAERVENEIAFRQAGEMGYDYFQGPFLNRPVRLDLKAIPSQKLPYLQLLQEVNKADFDFGKLESLIKRDLSLSFSLFRFVNSALFSTTREVRSVTQALALLGERALRGWVSILALSEMSKDKSEELLIQAAARGKFCEAIGPSVRLGHRKEELFLMGMFSMLDAILDCSLADALKDIPVAQDIKDALSGVPNELNDVYQYAMAYEDGDWHRVWTYAARLVTDEARLPQFYIDSVSWVEENLRHDLTTTSPSF